MPFIDQIRQEIGNPYYQQNFPNDGQRFIAWYLRTVLRREPLQVASDITDGADDKQIDAVVVNDDDRKAIIIQGKFIGERTVDSEPLREVLAAWMRLQDLGSLQRDCNQKLRMKIEEIRRAIDDEYELVFELITTGEPTDAAKADLKAFSDNIQEAATFTASLQLVDDSMLEVRRAEADALDLPSLDHLIHLDPDRTLSASLADRKIILTVLPLAECLRLPGIQDGRLFRKNVRQSLGPSNKVNKAIRDTLRDAEQIPNFFFFHNGVTALCDDMVLSDNKDRLSVRGLNVVNGCQSITTIYSCSEAVRAAENDAGILFRFYEIPNKVFADRISVNTNTQSAVKPRDLKSNDKVMVGLKRAYEQRYAQGYFVAKRGEVMEPGRDELQKIDAADLAKMLMAWHCQRPNIAYNEKKLFDEYYKILFRTGYDPASIMALNRWTRAINDRWQNLPLNDTLKASKSYARFHVLFSLSSIIAAASGQPTKVPDPSATAAIAEHDYDLLITQAANCLENAMLHARITAETDGKVFSPQNWMKSNHSVQGEMLVASTIAGILPNLAPEIINSLVIPTERLLSRWNAD